jgi:hypothetical protein
MTKTVKVCRIPGSVKDVMIDDNATVAQALAAAELTVSSGEAVKLDGLDTSMDAIPSDGSRIIVAKGAKGNV